MELRVRSKQFPSFRLNSQFDGQFLVLWMIGMLTYMGFGFVSPQFSVLITSRGFTLQQYGLIQGLATLLSIASQVGLGKLSDKIDRRKPILVGALSLLTPVCLLFPHATSLLAFTILLAVNQFGTSSFNGTVANWITRLGVNERLGRLHGYYRISFSVGWVLATWLMGRALDILGVTYTFYLGAAFLASALVLTVTVSREVNNQGVQVADLHSHAETGYAWTSELKVVLLALGIFTLGQTIGMQVNYIFFIDELGVTNKQFGLLTSIQSWPEIPLMLIAGIVADKVSSVWLVAVGMLLASLRWLGMAVVREIALLYLVQPLHAVAMTITEVVIITLISRQVPRSNLGMVMGWQVTVTSIARLLAPIIAGFVGEIFGIRMVFLSSSVVTVAAGLLCILWLQYESRRSGHVYLTEKEIFGQYEALRQTFDYLNNKEESIRELVAHHDRKSLTFIGCGSSYCLCVSGAKSTTLRSGLSANAIAAGDLLINFDQYRDLLKDTVIVAPSRSGGTSEVILAVKKAKAEGVPVIGITAKSDSQLGELADLNLELPWAFDESVCQTRTVTNLYAANLLLIAIIAGDEFLINEIGQAISGGDAFMSKYIDLAREIAQHDWENAVVLADSELEGIAAEAAIALTEIPLVHANYYHVLDVRHGPMVLIDNQTLVIAVLSPAESTLQKKLVEDLRGKGARVLTISQEGQGPWNADWEVYTPVYKNIGVMGIPFIFIPQVIGLYKALSKGLNPDLPPGLEPMIDLNK